MERRVSHKNKACTFYKQTQAIISLNLTPYLLLLEISNATQKHDIDASTLQIIT